MTRWAKEWKLTIRAPRVSASEGDHARTKLSAAQVVMSGAQRLRSACPSTTVRTAEANRFVLPAGQVLKITANATSSGRYRRASCIFLAG
jgi:hypothetical protein